MTKLSHNQVHQRNDTSSRTSQQRKLTVPGLAAEWNCSTDQVLRLIHAGELVALNVALKTSGRPRYLIDRVEVERFEDRRTVRPLRKGRQRNRSQSGVIEFF